MPRARPEAEEWLDLGDAEALAAFYREGDALALAKALKDKSGHSAFAHSLHRLALLLLGCPPSGEAGCGDEPSSDGCSNRSSNPDHHTALPSLRSPPTPSAATAAETAALAASMASNAQKELASSRAELEALCSKAAAARTDAATLDASSRSAVARSALLCAQLAETASEVSALQSEVDVLERAISERRVLMDTEASALNALETRLRAERQRAATELSAAMERVRRAEEQHCKLRSERPPFGMAVGSAELEAAAAAMEEEAAAEVAEATARLSRCQMQRERG